MSDIDYKAEVKKVYPEAFLNGDVDFVSQSDYWFIQLANGNLISDTVFYMNDAWQNAYNNLKTIINPEA